MKRSLMETLQGLFRSSWPRRRETERSGPEAPQKDRGQKRPADATTRGTPAVPLLVAGLGLGVEGDLLLRTPGPPALNVSVWVASIALAALVLHRHARIELDRGRAAWLAVAVVCAAGLAWRDAPPLKLLALGCVTVAFALAAYRPDAAWVRRAGVMRYAAAWASGALHAWGAAALVLLDTGRAPRADIGRASGWRPTTAAVARGLAIAIPLIGVFGALFMSADAVFANLVLDVLQVDVEWLASHLLLFSLSAWLATGYLRGLLTGTELPALGTLGLSGPLLDSEPRRPALAITEIAVALAAIDLLFLVFVIVQFRYLFGGDTIVQVTSDLTYAEYARRGFFELVLAVVLVVPVLLAVDWLLAAPSRRDILVFRGLAGLQVGLVFAIAASALQRLRLYYESYGLTESRLYATALLVWIAAMLVWLAATVLRGRRDLFAFGALASGFGAVAVLFAANPDAIVARASVARTASASARVRFDVAYAASLSADAVPVLIEAFPELPPDVQCALARHMLRRWLPGRGRSIRGWNWSAVRASSAVREQEARLQSVLGSNRECAAPGAG